MNWEQKRDFLFRNGIANPGSTQLLASLRDCVVGKPVCGLWHDFMADHALCAQAVRHSKGTPRIVMLQPPVEKLVFAFDSFFEDILSGTWMWSYDSWCIVDFTIPRIVWISEEVDLMKQMAQFDQAFVKTVGTPYDIDNFNHRLRRMCCQEICDKLS